MEKKEAMKILKDFHDKSALFSVRTALDTIIPELKKSEDEEIIKSLLFLCDEWEFKPEHRTTPNEEHAKEIRIWLEKQSEKPRYSIGDVLCDKSCTTLDKDAQPNFEITDIRNGMYICDKYSFPISQQDEYELVAKKIEQKPADKVEPKFKVGQTIKKEGFNLGFTIIKIEDGFYYNNMGDHFPFTDQDNWELVEKKPVWSEDDKTRLTNIIIMLKEGASHHFIKDDITKAVGWLNSLIPQNWTKEDKERYISCLQRLGTGNPEQPETINSKWFKEHVYPQTTWKPSESDILLLERIANGKSNPQDFQASLGGLIWQLKKLKD